MFDFPSRYPLTGPDYFQVVLDAHHRKHGVLGNLSRLVLVLDGNIDVERLSREIASSAFIQWIYSLRLRLGIFKKPFWESTVDRFEKVRVHTSIDPESVPVDIDPAKGPPIQFDCILNETETIVLFSWNHILMDARGAEILMMHIGSGLDCQFLPGDKKEVLSWSERLKHIHGMKDYIIERVRPIPTVAKFTGRAKGSFRNTVLAFSAEETQQMDRHCESHHVRLGKSAFYLAALLRAFQDTLADPSAEWNYWIPVPQDKRRKGVSGPVMSNQVSTLFYGIRPGSLESLHSAIEVITASMIDQVRNRVPESNTIMMDSMLWAPFWLYRYLVSSPTKGRLASLFFSDTGNSLDGCGEFTGLPLRDAIHYPPPSAMPGWTCIFMRVQGRQRVVISYPVEEQSPGDQLIDRFASVLKKELLG